MPLKIAKITKAIRNTVQFVIHHPLNQEQRWGALQRWLCWQIGSRLVPGPVAVPFVNNTRLLVSPGMTGATGNIYCGLHEFESMAFASHLLRPNDLFLDVGANIGSYSILAASVGAKCIAFEPVPTTYGWLLENINLNKFENLIDARNIAIGDRKGHLRMTTEFDTTNRVIRDSEQSMRGGVEVEVDTLNAVVGSLKPLLAKVDVEGYQSQVIDGSGEILPKNSLLAVILEIDKSETELHQRMLDFGFKPFGYLPFVRKLTPLLSINANAPNTIYVRDSETVSKILKSAPAVQVMSHRF